MLDPLRNDRFTSQRQFENQPTIVLVEPDMLGDAIVFPDGSVRGGSAEASTARNPGSLWGAAKTTKGT
jgi:hypothetical protein